MNFKVKSFPTWVFALFIFLISCREEPYNPKEDVILKLDISPYTFHKEKGNGPYQFEIPDEWTLKDALVPFDGNFCQEEIDIATELYPYPGESKWNGLLSLKYWKLPDKAYLSDLISDSFKYIDRERTMASAPPEYSNVIDYNNKVYGTVVEWKGNGVASPIQFYLTDSLENFIHGQIIVKYDSYRQAEQRLNHFKSGLLAIINTLEWLQD